MMTDVTDCEDDPCDANGSGGDEEAANIIGEFDDGYWEEGFQISYVAISYMMRTCSATN